MMGSTCTVRVSWVIELMGIRNVCTFIVVDGVKKLKKACVLFLVIYGPYSVSSWTLFFPPSSSIIRQWWGQSTITGSVTQVLTLFLYPMSNEESEKKKNIYIYIYPNWVLRI